MFGSLYVTYIVLDIIEIWYTDEKFSDLKAPCRLCPQLPAMILIMEMKISGMFTLRCLAINAHFQLLVGRGPYSGLSERGNGASSTH